MVILKSEILTKLYSFLVGIVLILYWYLEALFRLIVPPSMKSVDDETILVTGAVGGIGKEICRHLVTSGKSIKLVMWDLFQNDLDDFAKELRLTGSWRGVQVFPMAVDISSKRNIDEACKRVRELVGPVSIIFNNAAIAPRGNFLVQSAEEIERAFQVNLLSHVWIIQQFLPDMVARNHGRIVNMCSVLAIQAFPHIFSYIASKFAVDGYTESLKRELEMFGNDGIKVSTVYPYAVKSSLIGSYELKKNVISVLPNWLVKFLEPEYVARKTVDGMRREYEYIYLPPIAPFILLGINLLPLKFRKYTHASYLELIGFKNPEEQNNFKTSFCDAINGNVEGANGMEIIRNKSAY